MNNKKVKPSQTALKVALNIIALGNVPEMENILPGGIVSTTSELLRNSGATSAKRINKHHSPKIVSLYKKFDWLLPGQFKAFGFRKAFCEHNVKEAIKDGATQVLILGAGYDTIGFRLSQEFPQTKFFEIDQPATAELKIKGIDKMGPPGNLHFIPEDLSEKKLVNVLESRPLWNHETKSIIIAEGLLQYLSPNSVIELFEQCNLSTGPESRIVFTYIKKGADGKPYAGPRTNLLLWLLKITREPWLWATDLIELKQLLVDTGWRYSAELFRNIKSSGVEYFGGAIKK